MVTHLGNKVVSVPEPFAQGPQMASPFHNTKAQSSEICFGGAFLKDGQKWRDHEHELVAHMAVTARGRDAATGRPGLSGLSAGYRGIDRAGGCRLHHADGASGHAALSGGQRSMAAVLFPVAGSLGIGYLLCRYFPNARGSGVPQTKAALFAREGRITLRTVLGKFFCTSATLASGIPLGREGPSVQVGAGIASVLGRSSGCAPSKLRS